MTTDASAEAYRAALEFCGWLVTKRKNYGAPLLVCEFEPENTIVYPPRLVLAGTPVVELVVQSDAVVAISCRRLCPHIKPFAVAFHRYPLGPDYLPVLTGWQAAAWREALDVWVTAALSLLPAAGSTLAGP